MRRLGFLIIGLITLALLWFAFKPADTNRPPATSPMTGAQTASDSRAHERAANEPASDPPNAPVELAFRLAEDRPVDDPSHLTVEQGREVIVRITSDRDDELHLHGYDRRLSIHAGEPAEMRFVASHTGRFELELHRAHTTLAVIEVYPEG